MGTRRRNYHSADLAPGGPPRPGEVLQDWLTEHGYNQSWLGRKTGLMSTETSGIIHGRIGLGPVRASKLAFATDTTPGYWLKLQEKFDAYQAKHAPPMPKPWDQVKQVRAQVRALAPSPMGGHCMW